MKNIVTGFFLSCVLLVGSVFGAYVPTVQDETVIEKLRPLLVELYESSSEEFREVHAFLSNRRFYYDDGSRKQWLVDELFSITFEQLSTPKVDQPNDDLDAFLNELLAENNEESTGNSISASDRSILEKHIPPSLVSKDILMIEFTDLECPFCKRLHDSGALKNIEDSYENVGHLPLSFPLSFHQHAKPAAIAANCIWKYAGYSHYKAYIDTVFSRDTLAELELFLSIMLSIEENDTAEDSILACSDSNETQETVEEQMALGQKLGVTGTPGVIILEQSSGKYIKIAGAYPKEHFESELEKVLGGDWFSGSSHIPTPTQVSIPTPYVPHIIPLDTDRHAEFLETAYIQGNADAPVTIIEFSDVQCPFCQRHTNNGTLDAVREKYGDDVNIIYGHFPLGFHQNAQKAGEALECVGEMHGNTGFRAYRNAVYAEGGDSNIDILLKAAVDIGVDPVLLETCIDSGKYSQKVQDQMGYGQSLGVTGTPGNLVINNRTGEVQKISGAVPPQSFDATIQGYLK